MKLNVKVIAAVLGLVTMAMMLAACTREVIKEVPVTQVVTETVVKEVPVEVVVEKEVVKEVPVQRVVEVEVIKEVEVPVERVVEKEVVREVERPVVVEKEVVREVEVFKEVSVAEKAPAREVTKPVIVEKEIVREVSKVVEVVVSESASSRGPKGPSGPSTSPAPTSRSGGTPPATTFKDYQRERFVSAVRDAVSTFSLDTDRTSYYLALNWARTGYRVEPDSVRAEEWINAFNYGYEPPLHSDSFAISSDVVRHPLDGGLHLARIAFQAPDFSYDSTPVNVTLVLDASGSMREGNRVDIAREAAESIRRSLRAGDRIAIVHFTGSVIDRLTVKHSAPDDRDVIRSIERLAPHGSTNVQAGLDLGVRLADRARRDNRGAYNYIILMSDGVANVDADGPIRHPRVRR